MGNEIKRIREKFNLTQVELAKMLGVSQPRIARMEKQKMLHVNQSKSEHFVIHGNLVSIHIYLIGVTDL